MPTALNQGQLESDRRRINYRRNEELMPLLRKKSNNNLLTVKRQSSRRATQRKIAMKKTERFQNIKLDIQTVDFDPTSDIMSTIRTELKKLMRIYGNIVGADVYLQESDPNDAGNKMARIRVGLPGQSLFAEASSATWIQALTDVSGSLKNQILSRD